MDECQGPTTDRYQNPTPWGRWPARMLRHKATIQCARYAFGLSGIVDPDEAERIKSVENEEKDMGEIIPEKPEYPQDKFDKNFPMWQDDIFNGDQTKEEIIATIESKATITETQKQLIESCEENNYEDS